MQQANFILFTSFGGIDQYLKQVCIVFLAIIWSIDDSCCSVLPAKHSYGGRFIGEEEAKALPFDSEIRLAKIPCNGTTKVNCIYAEHRNHHHNEIVVSWVTSNGIINMTTSILAIYGNSSDDYHNVHANKPKNVYIYNRIIELLAYMMLASAFEVCLLVLRNLRTISLVFYGFWSALNVRVQKIYYTRASNKGIRHTRGNLVVGEKRTISYIFAILTWRATQTANVSSTSSGANLREESANNTVSYGHVTTMGDLLLLVLFTHVYYQRQKVHQMQKKALDALGEDHKGINYKSNANQLLYDKQTKTTSNNQTHCSRLSCSQNCGNMYQQLRSCPNSKSSLLQNCFGEQKLSQIKAMKSYEAKIQYGTVFNRCFPCHCSYRTCCYYFCYYCNCRRRNQRRYILYNICYCCCFYKSESCYDNNCYCCNYCCCIHCWKFFWNIRYLCSHCYHHCFCNFRLAKLNRSPSRVFNCFLLSKIKNSSGRAFRSLNAVIYLSSDYHILKLKHSNHCYSIVYLIHGDPTIIYEHNYHMFVVHLFNIILSKYLLSIRNFQSVKWRKLQVAMVVMVMIFFVISASNGTNYNHHHYYSSFFNKNFSRCKPHRRRHQHCKVHRSRHFFHSSLLQCIKHQKLKKKHKKCINKKLSSKQFSLSTISYEHSLYSLNTSGKAPLVQSIKRERGSKPNVLWLLIGLIWFEGPKIVNCNIILNYQNQQPHEQQHHQQQAGSSQKETTTNNVNSNFEYKTENFDQIKVKHNNNNSNNNKRSNKNKNGNSNNNNNKRLTRSRTNLFANMIPIFNTKHIKHYCNKNYQPKLIPSSQRIQRALKYPNSESSITSSASIKNNNIYEDLAIENIQSSYTNEEINAQSDHKRLESIKHQILSKLGLTRKPNVSQPLPKQFIWDTIYRADGIKSFNDFSHSDVPQPNHPFVSSAMLKGSNLMTTKYKQQQDSVGPLANGENQITSFGNRYIERKINDKTKQIRFKYNNGVLNTTKKSNQILNVTTNEDTLNHTTMPKIKMSNNNIIELKQQHHKFHKTPQHTTHHEQKNNNIIIRNQINNNTNSNNNANNELHHNNNINTIIIMVQKNLRDINNNNKNYTAEERKFTYLNDIKVSDDSLNSVQNHNSVDNNIIVRNQEDRREKLLDNTGLPTTDHANNADADIVHHENYLAKLDFLEESDDFFGSTQEIITFAEKGN